MAKYRVIKVFRDINTNKIYEVGEEIELSKDRAAEIADNLKNLGVFIVEVKNDKEVPERPLKKSKTSLW